MTRADVVATEDLLTFLGAATTDTHQREFYAPQPTGPSLGFLHDYARVNYRTLYAATLALRINDLNAALIIENLLASGAETTAEGRRTEGELIAARLRTMPPQRVYRLLARLCQAGNNNRRLRAIAGEWLTGRDLAFDAVKYRRPMRIVVRHLHLPVPTEVALVLRAHAWRTRHFETPLLETWRRAHYERASLYDLPFTVAEGLAASRGVKRELLVAHGRLTATERLRLQSSAEGIQVDLGFDLARAPLTRLAAYVLSLDTESRKRRMVELDDALRASALRTAGAEAGTWGDVQAVLDDSYSSSGSTEKRQRPLVVAVACAYLLEALADRLTLRWTSGRRESPLFAMAHGATDLANPVLDALTDEPDRLVIVSDGVDTSPPGAASEVLRVWSGRIDDGSTSVVHLNPVSESFGVRTLTPAVATLGIRDAEDLPMLVELARFATGRATHAEFTEYLASKATAFLGQQREEDPGEPGRPDEPRTKGTKP